MAVAATPGLVAVFADAHAHAEALDAAGASGACLSTQRATLGLVGHTHAPGAFLQTAAAPRRSRSERVSRSTWRAAHPRESVRALGLD